MKTQENEQQEQPRKMPASPKERRELAERLRKESILREGEVIYSETLVEAAKDFDKSAEYDAMLRLHPWLNLMTSKWMILIVGSFLTAAALIAYFISYDLQTAFTVALVVLLLGTVVYGAAAENLEFLLLDGRQQFAEKRAQDAKNHFLRTHK